MIIMGVTRSKYGYRVTYRGDQEYFADSMFGSPERAKEAADNYFTQMQGLLPKPKPGKPYLSDTWTQTGEDQRRVPCLTIYYFDPEEPNVRRNKKLIYENPDDRVEAARQAKVFLAARLREWEAKE